ncbi:EAL and HDOD domain-containing protein [Paraburkholderia phosphatilytica]|uniref:EAL and HDOD domain-containing protein n=1 Tax=Paraburkholderia phosphatilytica TaxID=2282883 RepID=UPI000E4BCAE2|nr:EAL domain-containing protein [Paraburkholderia phosphatilytica]
MARSSSSKAKASQAAVVRPDAGAPPAEGDGLAYAEPRFAYLGRQPILDRNGALAAYELLFRSNAQNFANVEDDSQATAHVVARTIGGIGVSTVLGEHRGYVNIGGALLFDDIVHLMDPTRFVLEILETVSMEAPVLERLAELRRSGFQIALDDVCELTPGFLAALPHVDFVKIDFVLTPQDRLMELAATVKQHRKTLIAEKIETRDEFELACDLGFDLFQGYFFARPQLLTSPRNRASRQALVRVLALLARDAGIVELEAELKHNPSLVVQLLRLVNSSAFGLGRNIGSLREAIIAAGTRQIARWAQLLLYADGNLPWRSDPLVQLAGTRSRFMELTARWLRPWDEELPDAAFMTGIFSLVHVVLGTTLADVIDQLKLARPIREAIVDGAGLLGALLQAAQAAERGDAVAALAVAGLDGKHADHREGLTPEVLAELSLSAAAWFGAHAAD